MNTTTYSKLEEILGGLNFVESIEGVAHPETVYEQMVDPKVEIVQVINSEIISLCYSKAYKQLKFVFSEVQGAEIDAHVVKSLNAVYKYLNDIKLLLNSILTQYKES